MVRSCLTTSATRSSRRVLDAVSTATLAAASQDWLLVPTSSVTRYTLSAISASLSMRRVSCHCRSVQLPQLGQHLCDLLRERHGVVAPQIDDLLGDAQVKVLPGNLQQLVAILAVPAKLERPPDLGGVATDAPARVLEHRRELFHPFRVAARDVPDVSVACDQPQGADAGRSDPEGRMWLLDGLRVGDGVLEVVVAAVEGGAFLREQRLDDAQRLAQAADAVVEALEAIHLVLDLGPRRADAELQAAAGKVIDGDGLLGQQGRVAVRVSRHEAADAHPLRRLGHRRLEGPAFVDGAVGPPAADRREVVEVPHVIEARLVRYPPHGAQVFDGRVLAGILQPEAKGMLHVTHLSETGWA